MKKILFIILTFVFAFAFTACGGNQDVLKVGATTVPHAEILNKVVKPALEKEGIKLEVIEFQDYTQPNVQLFEKGLDANYFQHIPWLEKSNEELGYDIVPVAGVHIEPIGAYSNKEKAYTSIDQLPVGATIAVTNSANEIGRVLALLEANGIITLKEGAGINGTLQDVAENPKNIQFLQLDPPLLPRALEDPKVDLAVINTNFALQANLNPVNDSIIIENADSPYVNVLAARPDNKNDEKIQKLAEVLTSDEVKKFIEENYKGAIVPAPKRFE